MFSRAADPRGGENGPGLTSVHQDSFYLAEISPYVSPNSREV